MKIVVSNKMVISYQKIFLCMDKHFDCDCDGMAGNEIGGKGKEDEKM